jgi:hypothetical protein
MFPMRMLPMNSDMRWQIRDRLTGPLGSFDVSSIATRGGIANPAFEENWSDETPWPFETMVFDSHGEAVYHAPLSTQKEAEQHHAEMILAVKSGSEFAGGVDFDDPMRTPTCSWRK